jgi:hypothetical protein
MMTEDPEGIAANVEGAAMAGIGIGIVEGVATAGIAADARRGVVAADARSGVVAVHVRTEGTVADAKSAAVVDETANESASPFDRRSRIPRAPRRGISAESATFFSVPSSA